MAAVNSTRARRITVQHHSWGLFISGSRELLSQHGYAQNGPFPGDPGVKKTVCDSLDQQGRAIKIRRASKTTFSIWRHWTDEEQAWYDKREAQKKESERAARMREGNATPSNRSLSSEDIEYLEYFYSLPIDEQTALLVGRGSDPEFIARNIMRNKETATPDPVDPVCLQRLTETEDSVICNYRLLDESGRKLIAGTLARVIASQISEAQGCNVSPLRGFSVPNDGSEGEPTSLQRLSSRESDLMRAYRVMDSETKEAVSYLFSSYLESSYLEDGAPCGDNVISIRR